jgi:hypothetical protein
MNVSEKKEGVTNEAWCIKNPQGRCLGGRDMDGFLPGDIFDRRKRLSLREMLF